MKKTLMGLLAIALVMILTVVTAGSAMAGKGDTPANDNPNNLYLYEKDADWDIVWGGAEGKVNFSKSGKVSFNGHGLTAGTEYSLVVYNGWPDVDIIGSGTANKGGNVHIKGSVGSLVEAKIWLVLADDVDGATMIAWNPGDYLFEHNLFSTN